MRLSPNFMLSEFMVSDTAARRGIDMTVPPALIPRLVDVCVHVLEPVRANFKAPVIVTSGYRPPALNKAVGGSNSSQHTKAEAADFHVVGVPHFEVCQWISRNCEFDQLILEFVNPAVPGSGWIHASYAAGENRKQRLTARRVRSFGRWKTQYLRGLHP
jgi:zinc D-Ala-D-Ala carboxypeptidase